MLEISRRLSLLVLLLVVAGCSPGAIGGPAGHGDSDGGDPTGPTPPPPDNPPTNAVPIAAAGPDQTVHVGDTVTLTGSGSDPDGELVSYLWTLSSSPAGSTATLSGTTAPTTSFIADVAGTYVLRLVVSDAGGSSAPDLVVVTVQSTTPPPVTSVNTPASITVTSQVIQTAVEPLGANLGRIAGGTNFAVNNHVDGAGFEPSVIRKLERVDRAGVDAMGQWVEWDGNGGVHMWDTNATGFGNGGDVRIYRIVDSAGHALPFAGGFTDAAGADHVVLVGLAKVSMPSTALPEGGWIADGSSGPVNRVYLDTDLGVTRGDYFFFTMRRAYVPVGDLHPRLAQYYGGDEPYVSYSQSGTTGRLVPHPTPVPAELTEPGETCLRVTAAAGTQWIGRYVYHPYDTGEGYWYSQLTPGASYRVSVWLRQEGLGNGGKVRFGFFGNSAYSAASQATAWSVTSSWQNFTYDFVGPAYPTTGMHIAQGLELTGPGTLWVDNFIVYRNDAKHGFAPFGPHEVSFDELMRSIPQAGLKPAVRFYGLNYGRASLESLLGNYGDADYNIDTGAPDGFAGMTVSQSLRWALATGATPATRVVPYFTLAEEYNEDDWVHLVEYLGVPYDTAVDTPATKPYAYRRFVQRGVGTPWTDEFRQILVEYGNETWHNGAGGYGWHGFSAPGAVHQGGTEYGLFARYMFREHVMAMPAWSSLGLGAKIKFVLGANYESDPSWAYGELAQKSGKMDLLGHANYVGPKWETGDTGSSTFNDHGVQETLVGMLTGMRDLIEGAATSRDTLNATAGTSYQLMAYEGGPSGYWTNGRNSPVDEAYGKSLAMGVAALDAWLFSTQHGYQAQCYLGFGSGTWWSSHTMPNAGGFRAHPGWLALRMRNAHANGSEMLAVSLDQVPAYARGSETLPLIGAYVFREGTAATYVIVLSRKLDGVHDGYDFGDGFTPVTLHLPFTATPRAITLYKLARPDGSPADPRDNNIDAVTVDIVEQSIAASAFAPDFVIDAARGGGAGGLPPGTVYLYVFEH